MRITVLQKEKPSEMIDAVKADRPSVGIFWVVEAKRGEPRLLAIGCTLEDAEPYGDFLTLAPATMKYGNDGARVRILTRLCA